MKNYALYLLIFALNTLNAEDLSWVDKQVDAIKPTRLGVSDKSIMQLKDPFVFLEKNMTPKDPLDTPQLSVVPNNSTDTNASSGTSSHIMQKAINGFRLSAIINNAVLINETWYKLNDTINGYRITSIGKSDVVLKNDTDMLVLTTKSKIKTLKLKNQ